MPLPSAPCARCHSLKLLEGEGRLPGDLVCAGHGDELLTQQDAIPGLHRAGAPDRHGPLPGLNLRAQMPAELPDDVFAAGH